ncbi:MAG: helix-turn-helix domain-containing protein [Bacteroidales bacterium]|nr:helix-turn-helix domain-containing protein [Bacteroidales bacterium]
MKTQLQTEKMMEEIFNSLTRIEFKLLRASAGGFDWIESHEASEKLSVSLRTLTDLRNSGDLPYSKLGRKVYFRLSDIQECMEKGLLKKDYSLKPA